MNGTRGNASKFVIGFGIAFAIITVLSGVTGWVFEKSQVDESTTTREVFAGIPTSLVTIFYIVVPLLIISGRPPRRTSSGASRTSGPASTCRLCCATPPPASCTR
jgi:hypothetical protein